jgi:trans-aconitate 2-methyltransferase
MVIRKKRDFLLKHLSDQRNLSEKIAKKITDQIDGLKYK